MPSRRRGNKDEPVPNKRPKRATRTDQTSVQASLAIPGRQQPDPQALSSKQLLDLQQVIGNRAVGAIVRPGPAATTNTVQRVNIPGVENTSDNTLKNRYNELYQSPTFRKEVHEILTKASLSQGPRVAAQTDLLRLEMENGPGTAEYDPQTRTVHVWDQEPDGSPKSPQTLRDQMFFELHNALATGRFNRIDAPGADTGRTDAPGTAQRAAYALANEWEEWINAANSTIRVLKINQEAGPATLSDVFGGSFQAGAPWLTFKGYMATNQTTHTPHYDPAAANAAWKGLKILDFAEEKFKTAVTLKDEEFRPKVSVQKPRLASRSNPFIWKTLKARGIENVVN